MHKDLEEGRDFFGNCVVVVLLSLSLLPEIVLYFRVHRHYWNPLYLRHICVFRGRNVTHPEMGHGVEDSYDIDTGYHWHIRENLVTSFIIFTIFYNLKNYFVIDFR